MARNPLRICCILLVIGGISLLLGCQQSTKTEKSQPAKNESELKPLPLPEQTKPEQSTAKSNKEENVPNASKEEKPKSKRTKSQASSLQHTIPKVVLTDALRSYCLVFVGDKMPDGEVTSSDGKKHSVQSLYGEKLTVVYFWTEGTSNYAKLSAMSALNDMQTDLIEPYSTKGLKVVGIEANDSPQKVSKELEQNGIKIPCYFDENGSYFGKVAKSMFPRIYLLDSTGKILWFDTEYSRSTRRNLSEAVLAVLGEK